jgi:hypothetical protein
MRSSYLNHLTTVNLGNLDIFDLDNLLKGSHSLVKPPKLHLLKALFTILFKVNLESLVQDSLLKGRLVDLPN